MFGNTLHLVSVRAELDDEYGFQPFPGAIKNMGNVNPLNQLLNPSGKGLTALGRFYVGN
jgi:hypothetical protein